MKIDWKKVSQSPGYKSLKEAYIYDVREAEEHRRKYKSKPMRDKQEFLAHFNWVINRAKHYAYKLNKPLEEVLNQWEESRSFWWLNYYQDARQPKISVFPRPYYETQRRIPFYKEIVRRFDPKHVATIRKTAKNRLNRLNQQLAVDSKRQGKKARWSLEQRNKQTYFRLRRSGMTLEESQQFIKNKGLKL